jgi:hypothetical protein
VVVALRLVARVGGIETYRPPLAPVGLQCRFLIVDQRHHDFPVARRVHLADESEVAVENALLDHRISGNLERVMLARAEQSRRNCETLRALERFDRGSGRDPSVQRDFYRVVGRWLGRWAKLDDIGRRRGGRRRFGQLDDFERTRPVGQPPDEPALLERRNQAMDTRLRLQLQRLTHFVKAWAHARVTKAFLDVEKKLSLLGGQHSAPPSWNEWGTCRKQTR